MACFTYSYCATVTQRIHSYCAQKRQNQLLCKDGFGDEPEKQNGERHYTACCHMSVHRPKKQRCCIFSLKYFLVVILNAKIHLNGQFFDDSPRPTFLDFVFIGCLNKPRHCVRALRFYTRFRKRGC